MRWQKTTRVGIFAVGLGLALAGCATGSSGTTGGSGGAPAQAGGATVSTHDVAGVGTVLVGADGRTLYFADQEANGQIKCMNSCVNYWVPVTVTSGTAPTAGSGVTGTLATVNRPDGSVQVTYDGKPLYSFTVDNEPGRANGNGYQDSFDGTDFTWHVVTPSGAVSTGAAPSDTSGAGDGYGGGGY